MVIHFMAFKGRLPYVATGETQESLNELRHEVQTFQGSKMSIYSGLRRYKQNDIAADLPDELHELLRLLLSRKPDQRPSCAEVLTLMNTKKPQRKLPQTRTVFSSSGLNNGRGRIV